MRTLILLMLSGASAFAACSITLTSPTASQNISGFAGAGNPNPFTFTSTLTTCPTIDHVQYFVDGRPAYSPGWGQPFSDALAPLYTLGIAPTPPFSYPWNTFWVSAGQHTATAEAFDEHGTLLATSSAVTFNSVNAWPVQCADTTAPTSNISAGSVTAGIVPISWSITGSCASDTISAMAFFIDGVTQQFNNGNNAPATGTINLDETQFQNGPHIISWTWKDGTHNQSFGSTTIALAGDQSLPLTFANGALPSQVLTACQNCYLPPSGTVSLAPTLLNTDSSVTTMGVTYDYVSTNPSVATVSSAGVVTAASSCPGPGSGLPCSAQILVMAETKDSTCNDLSTVAGGFIYWSNSCPFHPSDAGSLLRITSGPTTGVYQITHTDIRQGVNSNINLSSACTVWATGLVYPLCSTGTNPGLNNNMHFVMGPTAVVNILVDPLPTQISCLGADSAIHVAPNTNCIFLLSPFASAGSLYANTTAFANAQFVNVTASSPTYNYMGKLGPIAELDASAFNGFEFQLVSSPPVNNCANNTQPTFASGMAGYLSPAAPGVAAFTKKPIYLYGAGDNITNSQSSSVWNCFYGNASSWSPTFVATMFNAFNTAFPGVKLVGVNWHDEIDSQFGPRTLAGPITPGGTNSWLGASGIACVSTTCTANGTSQVSIISSRRFLVTGSSSSAINSLAGSSGYLASVSSGANSFTFTCSTCTTGTYNDAGLNIQPLADGGYTFNSNTSYIGYDMFGRIRQQAASQIYSTPSTGAPKAATQCYAWQNYMGNGSDGPILGFSQFGQYGDLYSDNNGNLPFITSRASINTLQNANNSPGFKAHVWWGCYNPELPWTMIIPGNENANNWQGYKVPISSISGSTMTFTGDHGLRNIVPGDTAILVSGNSALDGNYFVLGILSPTQLQVARQTIDFSSGSNKTCTTGTLTFGSGYSRSVPYIEATTAIQPYHFLMNVSGTPTFFGYGFAAGGFKVDTPDTNLPAERGDTFTVSGCSAWNGSTFIYAPTNLNVPSYATGYVSNIYWEVPNGAGTGGTAYIQPDASVLCGRSYCLRPGENDFNYGFAAVQEAMLDGASGLRPYKMPGGANNTYQPGYGYTGNSTASVSNTINNPTLYNDQNYYYPHWESSGQVPLFWGESAGFRPFLRWRPYWQQARCTGTPNVGWPLFQSGCSTGALGSIVGIANMTNGTQGFTLNLATACGGSSCLTSSQNYIVNLYGSDGTNTINTYASTVTTQTVTLQEGQAVQLVFPVTFAGTLSPVKFSPGHQSAGTFGDCPSGTTSITLRWAYEPYWLDAAQNTANLTSFPATIPADKNYGTVYGRVSCVGSNGTLQRSDVQTF